MRDAAARGVRIDVCADPVLNDKTNNDGVSQYDEAEAALSAIGVTLYLVSQLHSKIVAAD